MASQDVDVLQGTAKRTARRGKSAGKINNLNADCGKFTFRNPTLMHGLRCGS